MAEPATRRFDGQTVMITGAAGGFGRLAAQRFAEEGARLVLSDVAADGLAEFAASLHADVLAEPLDAADEEAVAAHLERAAARFGRLDIAINNAGVAHALTPLTQLAADEFDRVMRINARSVFVCMKHQLAAMVGAGGGAVLNVASAAGLVGAGQLSAYAASKHAVVGLTRTAADEMARRNVRVNALCPAFATTPLFDAMADGLAARHALGRDEADARILARVPMARVARAEEVVEAMLWITAKENSFMTGQAIAIDGGLTAI